jgi:cell fate (sporulation/competence/biofilm development) regulator YlbF (YheA/YmcA/DUF963 family)
LNIFIGFSFFIVSFSQKKLLALQWYNETAMENEEFLDEELQFLEDLRNSACYQDMQRFSDAISADATLSAFAQKRDQAYQKAAETSDESQKRTFLIQAKELDDQLKSSPKVKAYLIAYDRVRKVIDTLNNGILKEIA